MPPRSANRRASARAKKSTPKSRQPDVESNTLADDIAVSELENKDQELVPPEETGTHVSAAAKVHEAEEAALLVISEKETKQGSDCREETGTQQDDVLETAKVQEAEEGAQLVISEKKTKQESDCLEETGTQQDDVSAAAKVHEAEEAAQLVIAEKEAKRGIEVWEANSMASEGLGSGGGDKVVASSVVEVKVKEEVIEQERNTDIVMGDHANVNTEDVAEGCGGAEEERETLEVVENEGGDDENDNVKTADVAEKGENAAEENEGVEGEQNNGDVGNDGSGLGIVPVAEQNSAEEEATTAAQIKDAMALGDNNNVLVVNKDNNEKGEVEESGDDDDEDNEDSEEDNEYNQDDEDSVLIHGPLTDRKKQKDLEIFIGRLDKGTVEDDLIKVFGKFGEIKAARIVRNPTTKKSKGFAFVRYATVEQAKNALSELKDGIKVRGKHVKISASQDNDTLYMGNICKIWTKEHVLETLKRYGIKHVEEIHLPDDPNNEGRIKGFALLEFSTHSDAMAAFQRLRKPDAVFGRDRSAKVAFTQTPMHPNEEVLSQVKTVYVEGLTDAWNEEKVKEICKRYGEIIKVKLSWSLGTKRKDFGFITFTSRESALACVEGINNTQIGGEAKVKASIAKPHFKGRLQKQGFRGGFKVKKMSKVSPSKKESERAKQAGSSKMEGEAKSKQAKRKGKAMAEGKGKALSESKIVEGGKPNKPQSVTDGQSVGAPSKLERSDRKRKNLPSKVESRRNRGNENVHSKRPSKKLRGSIRGRESDTFRNPKRDPDFRRRPDHGTDPAYRNPYATEYAASTSYYQDHAHGAISASKRRYSDMEPHAGYLEPVAGKQGRPYLGSLDPMVGTQDRPHAGYVERAGGTQGHPHAGYLVAAVGTQGQPHASYPTVWTQGQSHAGYHGHNPYDPGLRRAGGHDGQGSSGSAYGGGSALPPSYVPNYSSYAGYEGGASVGGYDQSSGAYLPRRAYY